VTTAQFVDWYPLLKFPIIAHTTPIKTTTNDTYKNTLSLKLPEQTGSQLT